MTYVLLRFPSGAYDHWAGEGSLLAPEILELDRQLAEMADNFRSASPDLQRQFRASTTEDHDDTLLQFAKRASVFAMRERDERWIHSASAAMAIVDRSRIDAGDLGSALSVVHHAASRLRLDSRTLFKTAGVKSLEEVGYAEIEGPAGIGLVESEFESYEPTLNLTKAALAVQAAMRREGYEGDITIAAEPPSVWFPETPEQKAEALFARSRATVSLYGSLRESEDQSLTVVITEMRSEDDAQALVAMGADVAREPAITLLQHGQLVCVTLGHSSEDGVPSVESIETLRRFDEPFLDALRAAGD